MIEVQLLKIADLSVNDKPLEFFVKICLSKDTNAAVWDILFMYNNQVIPSTPTSGATRVCEINGEPYMGELLYSDLIKTNPFHWGKITKVKNIV